MAQGAPISLRTDGLRNGVELWAVTHLRPLWALAARLPVVRTWANRLVINQLVYKMIPRPGRLSTRTPYTTWASLTDRSYSARHLPPDPALQARLPDLDATADLFRQRPETADVSEKSTLLFPHFAQWFTDGFLRTDPHDPLKNTSTHDIDLSQLYGQTEKVTQMLRQGVGGRLKSQVLEKGEFPPYYLDADGRVKAEFAELPLAYPGSDLKAVSTGELDAGRRERLFALGIPRGNIHYGFQMISTLFLREHNRIAGLVSQAHPDWPDERVFQVSRNVLVVLLLKIVVEDYINHITPFHFKLFVEPGFGSRERWYRANWMSLEFNLLYRWHALVPTEVTVCGDRRPIEETMWDTRLVTEHGLTTLFEEASQQPSSDVGLLNTPGFLLPVERRTVEIGRAAELASFNDYRRSCRFPRLTSYADFSRKQVVQEALASCYRSADDVELYVGLFAEDVRPNAALPTLMGTMVAVDAFSQALTNPLLAPGIYGAETFSEEGLAVIARTRSLQDLLRRNDGGPGSRAVVSFTRADWRPTP